MKFDIKPVPPFSFDLSAGIFGEGDERIQRYENGSFWQVIRPNGKLVLVSMCSTGTVDGARNFCERLAGRRSIRR